MVVELHLDGAACNPQIIELAPEWCDRGLLAVRGMIGRDPRDHAIDRHDVVNIQTLYGRGNQCCITSVFRVLTPRDLRVSGFERHNVFQIEILSASETMSAAQRQ